MPTRIEIRGVIIPNDYQWIYDLFEIEATSPGRVNQLIQGANGDELEVIINSGGGDVFSGSEIYTALKDYPGDSVSKIVGIAASAASVAAMGTKRTMMSPTGQLMIHNASTVTIGDKREHRHTADFLQTVDASIANAYRLKTSLSQNELLSLMNKETWMNAQDALKSHFIDEIMFDVDNQLRAVASINAEMIPQKVIEKLRNEFVNLKQKGFGEMSVTDQNQQPAPVATTTPSLQQPVPQTQAQQPAPAAIQQPVPQAVATSAQADPVAAERERLKAIDAIAPNIDAQLVEEAKYGATPMSAEQLAFRAMKEGKMLNAGLFESAVAANAAAGTNGVQPQPQAQGTDKEIDLSTIGGANEAFAMFAANSQNHRPQMLARR
jgi:ATP-dependent Clp protease protease subunit